MKINLIFFLFCITLAGFFFEDAKAQIDSGTPRNQLEIQHDNDFLTLTDRYYSSGLFLRYRRHLKTGIFPSVKEQLLLELEQIAITPDDIDARDINKLDRPYAGYTGMKAGWSLATNDWFIETRLVLGFIGPSSGAGQFQRWFHENIIKYSTPTWAFEIEDGFLANIELTAVKEWQLAPNPFGVHLAITPTVAYGNKDVYVEPEMIVYLGRRSPLDRSIAYNQLGSVEKEIYFTFRLAYRYVYHNAYLEGNRSGDNSPFTIEPDKKLVNFGIDIYHRSNKNDWKFGFHALSREAPQLNRHKYLRISYARSF